MSIRLGDVLVNAGVLDERQVELILIEQQVSGEPFGLICERMFHVEPGRIEDAWATQYASLTRLVDPRIEAVDPTAQELVSRRQAWQFRVLPLRFDDAELMVATTEGSLRRALRFATNVIGEPVYFVMATPQHLGEALCQYYPLPGMTPNCLNDGSLDRLLAAGGKAA